MTPSLPTSLPLAPAAARLGLGLALATTLMFSAAARADDFGPRVPKGSTYATECSACHIAYPPRMLPAASWKRVMAGLDKHFGTDASLDAPTVKALSAWLEENAGSRAEPPEQRITLSRWFVRKHDEIPAATWKRASIKSASNCIACHRGADEGDFEEDNVRIPR